MGSTTGLGVGHGAGDEPGGAIGHFLGRADAVGAPIARRGVGESDADGRPRAGQAPRARSGTIRTRFNNVRAVLRGAVKDRIIAADPSDGVRLPRTRRAEDAMELPTPQQVRRFLDAAGPRSQTFVALCA